MKSLEQFLAEKDALEKFRRNVARQRGDRVRPTDLSAAFRWDETPEGYDYWAALSDEYDAYIVSCVEDKLYYGDDDGRAD